MFWWSLGCTVPYSAPESAPADSPAAPAPPPAPSTGMAWGEVRWEMTPEEAITALAARGLEAHMGGSKDGSMVGLQLDSAYVHLDFDELRHLRYVAIHGDGVPAEQPIAELGALSARFGAPVNEERSRLLLWDEAVHLELGATAIREYYRGDRARPAAPGRGPDTPPNWIGWGRIEWTSTVQQALDGLRADGFDVRHWLDPLAECDNPLGRCGHTQVIDFHRQNVRGSTRIDDRGGLITLDVEQQSGASITEFGRTREAALTGLMGVPSLVVDQTNREWRDGTTTATMTVAHEISPDTWSFVILYQLTASLAAVRVPTEW